MARESLELKRKRSIEVFRRLREEFPDPKCPLDYQTPFQLLVAVILSAQCTDERVNKVTPALFAAAPDSFAMQKLGEAKIRKLIRSINFFNNKAANLFEMSKIVSTRYGGEIPQTLDGLVELPGVGRKTANVVLGNIFKVPGIVVDTHVTRLCNRLGFTRETDAVKIEKELEKIFDPKDWIDSSHLLIFHGRKTCPARKPQCGTCVLRALCPSRDKEADAWKT